MNHLKIAILLPCYNEDIAISRVVRAFAFALPYAQIYVYDNNSTDGTVNTAEQAGAKVRHEYQQGKGHVVRRMFRDIEADYYVMADGDDTYDAALAPIMIQKAMSGPFDLVNCVRQESGQTNAYRSGHLWGNKILTGVVRYIFGDRVQDMLSGYKVFSRRFVKSFPAHSTGFDIETELTVHALEISMPIAHVEGVYRGRPVGSESKLRTYRDGWRILMLILKLIRHERPFLFFGVISSLLCLISVFISTPILLGFLETGLVPRLPTAVLSTGIMIVAALSFVTGIVLDTVTRGRRELRMLIYLQHAAPPVGDPPSQIL